MASDLRGINTYKEPAGPLRHRCSQCLATGRRLLRCGGCQAVRYCSREHQAAHRSAHKSACKIVKEARAKLAEEDDRVRNATPDAMAEEDAGHFHFYDEHIQARHALAGHLELTLGTLDGVSEALGHLQDILRMCPGDHLAAMDGTDRVPGLMLRLDLDQECYDLVKRWATGDSIHEGLPYPDLHGADVFEDPDFLTNFLQKKHIIATILLKLKLIVDIRNLKVLRKALAPRPLPAEIWTSIETAVIRSPLSAKLQKESPAALEKIEKRLIEQTRKVGNILSEAHFNFTFALLDPNTNGKPKEFLMEDWEQMVLVMQTSYPEFWDTEGVLDLLTDARACAAQAISEDELEGLMEHEADHELPERCQGAEQMLRTESEKRMWEYLDSAVANASYLGPWSKRPSVRRARETKEAYQRALLDENEEDWESDEDSLLEFFDPTTLLV